MIFLLQISYFTTQDDCCNVIFLILHEWVDIQHWTSAIPSSSDDYYRKKSTFGIIFLLESRANWNAFVTRGICYTQVGVETTSVRNRGHRKLTSLSLSWNWRSTWECVWGEISFDFFLDNYKSVNIRVTCLDILRTFCNVQGTFDDVFTKLGNTIMNINRNIITTFQYMNYERSPKLLTECNVM